MADNVYEDISYVDFSNGIKIEVVPRFVEERSMPNHNIFFYSYTVTVTNERPEACQLLKRYWIIKDGKAREEHVDGDGVIGQQPWIASGTSFTYASFCPLQTAYGNMRGRYTFANAKGETFMVRIPLFFFRPPDDSLNGLRDCQ